MLCLTATTTVSGACMPSCSTEVHLCHSCSCQAIEAGNNAPAGTLSPSELQLAAQMLGLPAAHIAQLAGRQLARREWLALAESAQPSHLSLQPQPSPPPPPPVQERGGADALEEELERVKQERAAARSAAVASQRQVQHESQRVAQLLLTIERLEESEHAREAGEPNGRPPAPN